MSVQRSPFTLRRSPFLLVALAVSCGSATGLDDVRLDEFEVIPPVEELDFSSVEPGATYQVWELRLAFQVGPGAVNQEVIASVGDRDAVDPELLAEFDTVRVLSGFDPECLPGHCYKFAASIRDGTIEVWNTPEQLVAFLGAIDTPEDAILVTLAHGYSWRGTKETGAIRQVGDDYELVALQLVRTCAPIQTNRYLLRISRSGAVTEVEEEVWSRDDGVCI